MKSCNTLQHFFIIETPLNSVSIQKINRKSKQFLARCRNSDGKYISATFKTRSEAEDFIAQNKKESHLPAELRISPLERADFARIKLICERYGKTIKDAASIIEEYLKNKKESTPPVFDAVKLFLDACEKRKVRPSTLDFYRRYLKRFCDLLLDSSVCTGEFNQIQAQSYIDSVADKVHTKSVLRAFWSWLVENGYATENVFFNVKINRILKDKSPIPLMSVKDTRENIDACPDTYKPLYALMAFAGIRPEELLPKQKNAKLEVSDVDFESKKIIVRAEVAKMRTPRVLMNLPSNIWPWLEPIKKWGKICPNGVSAWYEQKKKLPHKIPQDALRHSFASYAYYALGVEHAVEILGHDYKTYKKFYKGLASLKDSEEYFKILPANV